MKRRLNSWCAFVFSMVAMAGWSMPVAHADQPDDLDRNLTTVLKQLGFTGRMQSTLEGRLGRSLDPALVNLGQLLWFDSITSLGNDNSCSGCHSPAFGFGDSQSIAIGVENNGIVGPDRAGPRNQRRTPQMINTGFYPGLMWNARFSATSHDPFDLSEGARVPFFLGGTTVWRPGSACIYGTCFDPRITRTLLGVQANFPPTETIEVAGFAAPDLHDVDPRLYYPVHLVSSGLYSDTLPEEIPGPNGSPPDSIDRGYAIRQKVLDRLNATPNYIARFAAIYPEAAGGNITMAQVGAAIAEFEFSNTFADAPIDRFARGQGNAMTPRQKQGALLFFGKIGCVACHSVAGESHEMFSDFQTHVAGIPQVAPRGFGLKPGGNPQNPDDLPGNFEFSGPNHDEDFGREELTGDPVDRYAFRTAPLRNLRVQPAFFHNGAFTRLQDALRYHLNTIESAPRYDPIAAGLDWDLTVRRGPVEPVLKRLDSRIAAMGNVALTDQDFEDLLEFLRDGLLDERALPANLCRLVPASVPSGRKVLTFQGCH